MNLKAASFALSLTFLAACNASAQTRYTPGQYAEFDNGAKSERKWIQSIVIKAPEPRIDVKGDVKVAFTASGMKKAVALCWRQPVRSAPAPTGHDTRIGEEMTLDEQGNGSFTFPAAQYPSGPVTVRILAWNDTQRDVRELQLYNQGGTIWNQGVPKKVPPAASGLKLIFEDDFNAPLSISRDGKNARYTSHKPGGGDFSGWPFSDFEGDQNPFARIGTFLRIRASKTGNGQGSTGLLAPVKEDGSVLAVKAPAYFECRFTAQSAPGTWPAFWLLTQNKGTGGVKDETDELDIVEAYGGVGEGNPNHPGYSVTSHFWGQKDAEGKNLPDPNKVIEMMKAEGGSYWSTTFHTYGVKVTETDTIYYLDNKEVFRHASGEISKTQPHFFLINYAIGGISGWKIDLEREGNTSDMFVDYVRVYGIQ